MLIVGQARYAIPVWLLRGLRYYPLCQWPTNHPSSMQSFPTVRCQDVQITSIVLTGADYPTSAPSVTARTTNGGRCRFNPNIYSGGKVCLSILGTWRAQPSEEWSSAQGLESILISIQSLMSPNPYENEPGYEKSEDQQGQSDYIAKVQLFSVSLSTALKYRRSAMKRCASRSYSVSRNLLAFTRMER